MRRRFCPPRPVTWHADDCGLHFTVNSLPLPQSGTQRRSQARTDRR
ncbi:MAG: hypothetical protein DMG86_16815 [Acidobacteria bacterium]|nr:MAG: hypothetical protein DMG86_16815 [Acidobacteriota bacterium]PYX15662.1 MAG: hypothetical protein DMG84_10895 [Acidobacteriota bacterium]